MKLVILGAGASLGFDSSRPAWERPPGSDQLLERGRAVGILDDPMYTDLVAAATEFVRAKGLAPGSEFHVDLEELLAWIASEFDKEKAAGPPWERPPKPFDAQAALGQATYFLYEVLRIPIACYEPRGDAYHRLALSFRREPYQVISLNYDTLFELAVARAIGGYAYLPPVPPGAVPIAKLHGSVNWLNAFSPGIAVRSGGDPFDPRSVIRFIWSNQVHAQVFVQSPEWPQTHSARDIVPSGERYYEPALVPPVGLAKDFDKVTIYQQTLGFARGMVANADELVLVGTSVRAQDTVLCDLVKTALANKPRLVAVGNASRLKTRLLEIVPGTDVTAMVEFPRFEDYARAL